MTILSTLGGELQGALGTLSDLAFGKSIKKVASKVKSKVKTGAKTYAASTPQGRAASMAVSATKKSKPATKSSKGMKVAGKKSATNQWTNKTLFGIPIVTVAVIGIGAMFFLRK